MSITHMGKPSFPKIAYVINHNEAFLKGFKVGIKVFFAKQQALSCRNSQQGSSAF